MIELNIGYLSTVFLMISGSSVLAAIGSICITVYYLSMLKKNVINIDFNRSWIKYFKAWFKKSLK
jgi:hypothetical protein